MLKGSEFVLDYVHLLYYKCHKRNPNLRGLHIDSSDWIKNKKATINPINKKDSKCFPYAARVTLNRKEMDKNPETVTKIKPFINEYKKEGIKFHQKKMIRKKLRKKKL